jgi:hypothetical protein
MMPFLKLTTHDGQALIVRPEQVAAVQESDRGKGSLVYLTGSDDAFLVKESLEDVESKLSQTDDA